MRTHALVIGIDGYRHVSGLSGCVNDASEIADLVEARLGVTVQRLLARDKASRDADLGALRAALARLASDAVAPGDRVFLWYAGHGTQVRGVAGHEGREALVPADYQPGTAGLWWDVELNRLLHAIAARCGNVTMVLDCCDSGGATRDLADASDGDPVARTVRADVPADALPDEDAVGIRAGLEGASGVVVVAACQADQTAKERTFPDGRRNGVLTRAFLDVLRALPAERAAGVRWFEIWEDVRARVLANAADQHPILLGDARRPVFGGPPLAFDPGLTLVGAADGKWTVRAGTLAGVSPGARIAVYAAAEPPTFPPVGSPEDLAARVGTLSVRTATPSTATATADAPLAAFPGARGRVVVTGAADRLRVWSEDPALRALVEAVPTLAVVDARDPEVELGSLGPGRAWLSDRWYGRPGDAGLGPLTEVATDALPEAFAHLVRYLAPIRAARRATGLADVLALRLLDGSDPDTGGAALAPSTDPRWGWELPYGAPFVFELRNTGPVGLYTTLLDLSPDGTVIVLAKELQIPAGETRPVFFLEQRGQAFAVAADPALPGPRLERVVVLATDRPGVDFAGLGVDDGFAAGHTRAIGAAVSMERWFGALHVLRIADDAAAPRAIEAGSRTLRGGADLGASTEDYERDEADVDAPVGVVDAAVAARLDARARALDPFAFTDHLVPVTSGQAVSVGWLQKWGARPRGVTWHWGASGSLASLTATIGGANPQRKGVASAHYGVGRRYTDGVHRYVALTNRSWHAGKEQRIRWDGAALTDSDERGVRSTVGIETDHRGHVLASASTPADWWRVRDATGLALKVQPWTEEQIVMMIAVGKEIQAAWPLLTPRDHHGHSDLCPGYKTDVAGFPFARVLRGIYDDPTIPDVWTPFHTIEGRQRALILLGHDLGASGADGDWGKRSRAALAAEKATCGLVEREHPNDPQGGRWSTFVGWAIHDRLVAAGQWDAFVAGS